MRSWRTICECETVAVGTERGGGEGIGQDLIGDRIGLKPYLLSERQLQRGQNFGYQFLAECEESTPRPGHTHRTPFRKVSLPPVSPSCCTGCTAGPLSRSWEASWAETGFVPWYPGTKDSVCPWVKTQFFFRPRL